LATTSGLLMKLPPLGFSGSREQQTHQKLMSSQIKLHWAIAAPGVF